MKIKFNLNVGTGLKDKNGREIYEGNTVVRKDERHKVTGKIVYEFGMFWIIGKVYYKNMKKIGKSIALGGHTYIEKDIEIISLSKP